MWKVAATFNGQKTVWPFVTFEDPERPGSLAMVLEEAGEKADEAGVEAPFDLMEAVADRGHLAAADSIALWGEAAAGEFRTGAEGTNHRIQFDDGRRLQWFADGGEIPESSVWNENTLIAVPIQPGLDQLDLISVPGREDRDYASETTKKFSDSHQGEIYRSVAIEWRAYVGRGSGIIDGPLKRGRRLLLKSIKTGGLLVGKVFNSLSSKSPSIKNDLLQFERQRRYEDDHQSAANQFHDLRSAPPFQGQACIVVVHGTASCGLEILKHFEMDHPEAPTFRFEHDTFLKIADNASELAELICERLDVQKILMVAHSRGGLVACHAYPYLKKKCDDQNRKAPAVEIRTYGTPFEGSPLVRAGERTLGWLYKLGTRFADGLPHPWAKQLAMGSLFASAVLPDGIADMEPDSSFLKSISNLAPNTVSSHAGQFDPMISKDTGFGLAFIKGLSDGAFDDANDLVVPTASAAATGSANIIEDCDHFSYFKRDSLHKAIMTWRG